MRSRMDRCAKGGVWFGGQAYFMCSREALKIASRPQNIPAVRRLFSPDLYFSDTIFAVGPQECFSPDHPLTARRRSARKATRRLHSQRDRRLRK